MQIYLSIIDYKLQLYYNQLIIAYLRTIKFNNMFKIINKLI